MQRNHSSLTNAWSHQVLSTVLLPEGWGTGIKTLGSLAREQRVCVGESSWVFIRWVNQLVTDILSTWKLFVCSHACIYCPGVGVTGYEVFFKQGKFSITLIHLCSVFTAERENVRCPDLIPHQKVVSVSESLPMLIAGCVFQPAS